MRLRSVALMVCGLGSSTVLADVPVKMALVPVEEIPVPAARAPALGQSVALQSSSQSPATQPVQVAQAMGNVVILPFEPLGDTEYRRWVPRAVQQSIASEVARLKGLQPIAVGPAASGTSGGAIENSGETAVARQQAKANNGDIVIYGSCQFNGTDVRLTGEIESIADGRALGGLKASGDFKDLFELEDVLAGEVQRILRPAVGSDINAQNKALAVNPGAGGAPSMTAKDLFAPSPDTVRFGDQYNRYYYAPAYLPYLPLIYGGGGYLDPVYSIYQGGYYPNIGGSFPFGDGGINLGGFDGVTVIITRRDHRRDGDHRGDRDGDGSTNSNGAGTTQAPSQPGPPPPPVRVYKPLDGVTAIQQKLAEPMRVDVQVAPISLSAPEPVRLPPVQERPEIPVQNGSGGLAGQTSQTGGRN